MTVSSCPIPGSIEDCITKRYEVSVSHPYMSGPATGAIIACTEKEAKKKAEEKFRSVFSDLKDSAHLTITAKLVK